MVLRLRGVRDARRKAVVGNVFSPFFIGPLQGLNEQFVRIIGFGLEGGDGLVQV